MDAHITHTIEKLLMRPFHWYVYHVHPMSLGISAQQEPLGQQVKAPENFKLTVKPLNLYGCTYNTYH